MSGQAHITSNRRSQHDVALDQQHCEDIYVPMGHSACAERMGSKQARRNPWPSPAQHQLLTLLLLHASPRPTKC